MILGAQHIGGSTSTRRRVYTLCQTTSVCTRVFRDRNLVCNLCRPSLHGWARVIISEPVWATHAYTREDTLGETTWNRYHLRRQGLASRHSPLIAQLARLFSARADRLPFSSALVNHRRACIVAVRRHVTKEASWGETSRSYASSSSFFFFKLPPFHKVLLSSFVKLSALFLDSSESASTKGAGRSCIDRY